EAGAIGGERIETAVEIRERPRNCGPLPTGTNAFQERLFCGRERNGHRVRVDPSYAAGEFCSVVFTPDGHRNDNSGEHNAGEANAKEREQAPEPEVLIIAR